MHGIRCYVLWAIFRKGNVCLLSYVILIVTVRPSHDYAWKRNTSHVIYCFALEINTFALEIKKRWQKHTKTQGKMKKKEQDPEPGI